MNRVHGFTLIELMIVVAILALLMAIALPAYQDYSVRAKVSEGMALTSAAKLAVADMRQTLGYYPATANTSYGLPSATSIFGNHVESVDVAGGTGIITILYRVEPSIAGKTVTLTPSFTTSAGSLSWSCTGGDVLDKYRPANCR